MDLLRIIIAILLPPLGVFLQVEIAKQDWINIHPGSLQSQKHRLQLHTKAGNLRVAFVPGAVPSGWS
jgi:Proteolipid membrane potential modulator